MGRTWALLFLRWISGLIWLMAGWWKCFELGPTEHARRLFVEPYADRWIPEFMLWAWGTAIPVMELLGGLMLLLGLWTRGALVMLGVILVLVTYGHLLVDPLFDTTAHIFPRTVFLVALLLLGSKGDRFSLDDWLARRRK